MSPHNLTVVALNYSISFAVDFLHCFEYFEVYKRPDFHCLNKFLELYISLVQCKWVNFLVPNWFKFISCHQKGKKFGTISKIVLKKATHNI